jgi:O-antigen ligase
MREIFSKLGSRNLLLALVAALPLFSYPASLLLPAWGQARYGVAVPFAVIVLAGLLAWAASRFCRSALPGATGPESRAEARSYRALLWPALALAVSFLLSVQFSRHPHFSLLALPGALSNLAVFLLAASCPVDRLRPLCWWWTAAAALVAVNGLARLGIEPEFASTIGNRNFLGTYLAASVFVAAALKDKRAGVICLLLLSAMYFCHSRGAWLALAGGAVCWFLVWQSRPAWITAIVGLMVLAGTVIVWPYIAQQWRTDVRPMIWAGTLRMIADRPVVGHGLGTFIIEYPQYRLPEYFLRPKAGNLTNNAHNELLEVAAEQGLLGLAATAWLWGAAFTRGLRSARTAPDRWLRAGLVGATGVFLLHAMIDVDLRYWPNQTLFWILLGLLASGGTEPPVQIRLRSPAARAVAAAACLLVAGWICVVGVINPMRASVWERRSRLANLRGEKQTAIAAAERALQIQPFRLTARYHLAGLLWETEVAGQRVRTLQECLTIYDLAPDHIEVTYRIAQIYLTEGRAAEALPFAARAVEINPYDPGKRVALAYALAGLGRARAAELELRQALRLAPDHKDAHTLLEQLEQGDRKWMRP